MASLTISSVGMQAPPTRISTSTMHSVHESRAIRPIALAHLRLQTGATHLSRYFFEEYHLTKNWTFTLISEPRFQYAFCEISDRLFPVIRVWLISLHIFSSVLAVQDRDGVIMKEIPESIYSKSATTRRDIKQSQAKEREFSSMGTNMSMYAERRVDGHWHFLGGDEEKSPLRVGSRTWKAPYSHIYL